MIKSLYIDLETTGLNPILNGIVQVAVIIELDGKVKDSDTLATNVAPLEGDEITAKALEVTGLDEQVIKTYPNPHKVFGDLKQLFGKYVDPFNPQDKYFFVGYNAYFDYQFMRNFWNKMNDKYFGSWFWYPPLDVMILAQYFLRRERHKLKRFTLSDVAKYLGIPVEDSKLHGAVYDTELVRTVYHTLVNKS